MFDYSRDIGHSVTFSSAFHAEAYENVFYSHPLRIALCSPGVCYAFVCRCPTQAWELPLRLFELGGVYESYGSFEGALSIYQHIASSMPFVAGFEDALFRCAVVMRYMASLRVRLFRASHTFGMYYSRQYAVMFLGNVLQERGGGAVGHLLRFFTWRLLYCRRRVAVETLLECSVGKGAATVDHLPMLLRILHHSRDCTPA